MPINLNPRLIWAYIYVSINLIAVIFIEQSNSLIGDLQGYFVNNQALLVLSVALVIFSIFILYRIYKNLVADNCMTIFYLTNRTRIDAFVGLLILCFIVYVNATGHFIASSTKRGENILSMLWVIFNVDLIFFVYYINCRNNKWFYLILFLWAISSIQRGWFSFPFVIFGLESMRLMRRKIFLSFAPILFITLMLIFYPIFDLIKVNIREFGGFDFSNASDIIFTITQDSSFNWLDSTILAIEKIVGRLQTVSHVYVIFDNLEQFFLPQNSPIFFLKEGIFGIAFDKIFGFDHGLDVAQVLANFISPNSSSSWNVNPSIVGWISVHFYWLPFTLLYIYMLCKLSINFQKRLQSSTEAYDFIWFFWLGLLLPGWIAQFVSFVFTQFLFLVITRLLCSSIRTSPS